MPSTPAEPLSSLAVALADYEAALKAVYHNGEPLTQNDLNERITAALGAFDCARDAMVAQDLRTGTALPSGVSEQIRADLAQLDARRRELEMLTSRLAPRSFQFRMPSAIAPAYDLVAGGGHLAPTKDNAAILQTAIAVVKTLEKTYRSILQAENVGQMYEAIEAVDDLI